MIKRYSLNKWPNVNARDRIRRTSLLVETLDWPCKSDAAGILGSGGRGGPYWGTVRTAGRGGVKRMGVMGGAMALWAGQGNNRSPLGGAVARSAGLSPYFVLSLHSLPHLFLHDGSQHICQGTVVSRLQDSR